MGDLSKYDIYKIEGIPNDGYIFSIVENEDSEEKTYRYYMVIMGKNNVPMIKRLTNTIEILSSNQYALTKVETESEEILRFIRLLSKSQLPRQSQLNKIKNSALYSEISESDIKLLQLKPIKE